MKKQLLCLMILLPKIASADAVEIDGIYYNLIAKAELRHVNYMKKEDVHHNGHILF